MLTNNHTETPNTTFLIPPIDTHADYADKQHSHFVVINANVHLNKLLLLIGGSNSVPQNYLFICEHAASIGFDVISISYPNSVSTATLSANADPMVFDNYHNELCFGQPVSNVVSVDPLNSINTRSINLLKYLASNHPDQNWGQYLNAEGTIVWNKVAVAGHSQGAGHACYMAKMEQADRVLMFAGPNDYSTYFNAPARWLKQPGETPVNKHFALLHARDEIASFDSQVANLRSMGLLRKDENPPIADELSYPFLLANVLALNIPAISAHSSPVGRNVILPNIWTYMLTATS